MVVQSALGVVQAFRLAWRLKRPFLISQVAFNILIAAFLAPLLAVLVRGAIALSGKPALSDFDIAYFLLSPAGFVKSVSRVGSTCHSPKKRFDDNAAHRGAQRRANIPNRTPRNRVSS